MNEVNLIGGFYKSKSLPFSAQDLVNWLPVPSKAEGSRSPIKLRGLPGLGSINPPVIVITQLTISGDAPGGTEDAAYSFTYSASGGTEPYVFDLLSGSLPNGLSLSSSGVLSGTLTLAGTFSFVVRVTDADGQQAQLSDTIAVSAIGSDFPVLLSITNSSNGTLNTTHSANYPATVASGDLLILVCAASKWEFDGGGVNVNLSTPSGFTLIASGKPAGNSRISSLLLYRIANGTESGAASLSSGGSAYFAASMYRYQQGTFSGVPTASSGGRTSEDDPRIEEHDSGITGPVTFFVAVAGSAGPTTVTNAFPFASGNAQVYTTGGGNVTAFTSACTINDADGGILVPDGAFFDLSGNANSMAFTASIGGA